ncbi:MAG: GHKL domain-containing protein [Ignavibacteria bacterium]|nr:GHKL domain-containing protein [Ignavibacteria bacterium]
MKFRKSIFSSFSPKTLLGISVVAVIGVVVTFALEYNARKTDYLQLLENQGKLFIDAIVNSTQNAITAAEKIETEIDSKILLNINMLGRIIYSQSIPPAEQKKLFEDSGFDEIILYNSNGSIVDRFSKHKNNFIIPKSVISSLVNKSFKDTIMVVYDEPEYETEQLTAFVKINHGNMVAAFINNEEINNLKNSVGIGYFLKRFYSKQNLQYVVIQNSFTIVAGSFGEYNLSTFTRDSFLQSAIDENKTLSRIIYYSDKPIYELVSPLNIDKEAIGILRIGLAMDEYERFEADMTQRYIMVSIILVVFGIIFFNFFVNYNQRQLLKKDLGQWKNYTNTILENLSSGVVGISNGIVISINNKALDVIGVNYSNAINKKIVDYPVFWKNTLIAVLNDKEIYTANNPLKVIQNYNQPKLFTISNDEIKTEEGSITNVLIINDITEQKLLEDQLRRNQKLNALGNLASSVAHEIKNPLNAIKLIIELVRKKFQPANNLENYLKNLDTVSIEIDRVNRIIEQYLQFNKMPELRLNNENIKHIVGEVCDLFKSEVIDKQILLTCNVSDTISLICDKDQIKQALINLIKNAIEAIEKNGKINISVLKNSEFIEILVADNGKGIHPENLDFIFDLHYSTKKSGNGIGLFIVQQIILAHKGKLFVESSLGIGSTFKIQLPVNA